MRRQLVGRQGARLAVGPGRCHHDFLSLAAGVDMLAGVGMVSGGRIFSYEEMALAAEMLGTARAVAGGAAAAAQEEEPLARAHRRVADLVAHHVAPPLDPAVDAELRRLAEYPAVG